MNVPATTFYGLCLALAGYAMLGAFRTGLKKGRR